MPQLELSALVLSPRHREQLLSLLARHVPTAEVWAYGSRVTGEGHEGSDLDLVLRNPDNLAEPVVGAIELVEALQKSSLPMLVDTHLWSELPALFWTEIERAYVVLQTRTRGGA